MTARRTNLIRFCLVTGAVLSMGLAGCKDDKAQSAAIQADETLVVSDIAGMAENASIPAIMPTVKFQCGDAEVFFTPIEGGGGDLRIANVAYAMEQAISASGARYTNLGDETTVFWSKGNTAMVTVSGQELPECHEVVEAPRGDVPVPTDIRGVEWHLEDLNGGGIIDNASVTIEFDAEGRVFGRSACNRYTSGYTVDGANVTILPQIASTMMACPPALMELERKYLDVLPGIESHRITEDGALILTGAEGTTLTFRVH